LGATLTGFLVNTVPAINPEDKNKVKKRIGRNLEITGQSGFLVG
jgi:hypothetical protein